MKKPIRTTCIFGLISALCAIPLTYLPAAYWGWPMAHKFFLLLNLASYTLLLCRWSRTPVTATLFPIFLLVGVALWPNTYTGFILVSLVVFSWIRSGICYRRVVLRALTAEIITMVSGSVFVLFWWPDMILAQPLAIWLFFLIQSLYFFIVPGYAQAEANILVDSFQQASRDLEQLLETRL